LLLLVLAPLALRADRLMVGRLATLIMIVVATLQRLNPRGLVPR